MKRIIGLDLGNITLGVAMTDESHILCSPYENYSFKRRDFLAAAKHVVELCEEFNVEEIALGNPLMPSGDDSVRTNISKKFASMILNINPDIKVTLIDERFTSVEAKARLKESHYNGKKGRVVDSVAATLILESYMGQKSRKTP